MIRKTTTLGIVSILFLLTHSTPSYCDEHDDNKPFKLIPTEGSPSATQLLKPFSSKPDNSIHHLVDRTAESNDGLEFKCVQVRGGWRPQSLRTRGHNQLFPLLGREPIPSKEICDQVVASSNNGVVCSNTGVAPYYKPTHFSGSTEYRKDFGFWGSSTTLADCLIATRYSSKEKVCYWGGSDWYIGDITGAKRNLGGPFKSVKDCVRSYGADPTQKKISPFFASPFEIQHKE